MSLNDLYEKWRQHNFQSLENLVQKRFHHLMNLKNCTLAKRMNCVDEYSKYYEPISSTCTEKDLEDIPETWPGKSFFC